MSPFTQSVGFKQLPVTDLRGLRDGEEGTLSSSGESGLLLMLIISEIVLKLDRFGKRNPPHLAVKLDFSDVKENATIALKNLVALVNNDGEITGNSEQERADDKFEQVLKQGKAVMQNKLSKSVQTAVPLVDLFLGTIDNVVQVPGALSLQC